MNCGVSSRRGTSESRGTNSLTRPIASAEARSRFERVSPLQTSLVVAAARALRGGDVFNALLQSALNRVVEDAESISRAEAVTVAVESGEQRPPPELPRNVRVTRQTVFLGVIRNDAATAEAEIRADIERLRWASALFWSPLAGPVLAIAGAAVGVALLDAGRIGIGAVSLAVPPLAIFGTTRLHRASLPRRHQHHQKRERGGRAERVQTTKPEPEER